MDTIILADQVIDGVKPEPIRDLAVIVRGDRVYSLMPRKKLSSGTIRNARLIEAYGSTLMPGLIDCHAHLVFNQSPTMQGIDQDPVELVTVRAAKNAETLVNHGYTTIRDVGSRGAVSIGVGRMIRELRLKGPRVLACGPLISTTAGTADSYPPWIKNSTGIGAVVDGLTDVQREVRRQAKMGANHVKLGLSGSEPSLYSFTWMTTMSHEEVMVAVAEAHRMRLRVACHSQSELSSLYAAMAGCDTIEHGTRLTEEIVSIMIKKNIILVPTLCTLFSVLDLGEKLGLGLKQREEMKANKSPWLDSLRMAHSMGVKIAAGGDIGNRYRHGENAKEIGLLAKNGLLPMEALLAATSVASQALGLDAQIGRIYPGYFADLIVFKGDPLQNLDRLLDEKLFSHIVVSGRLLKGR